MIPDDRKDFIEVLMGFAELKGKQLSAPAMELYWRALQHWPLDAFKMAAEQLLRTCEFLPLPKDFEDLRKTGRPTSGEAWIMAVQNASSAIVCGQVTHGTSCGDSLIDRAARAVGGYGVIAMTASDKLCHLEKRFVEHFESMQEADDMREAVPRIASTFKPRLTNGNGPKLLRDWLPDGAG